MQNNTKTLKFESPIPESVNHYLLDRVIRKGTKNLVIKYPSKGNVEYKKIFEPYIKQIVKDSGWDKEITRGKHYILNAIIYFGRIDQDEQNYWKMPCDIMNDIVYIDDSNILTRCTRIYYTYNKNIPPHIEFELFPVDYIGIFNDIEEYDNFIDKCVTCRNYKDGACKKLEEFMAYKITEHFDVNTRECLKFKESKEK